MAFLQSRTLLVYFDMYIEVYMSNNIVYFGAMTNCVDGSITGTVTFSGVPTGYSGNIYAPSANVVSWSLSAPPIGSLGTGNYLSAGFYFVSGVMHSNITAWPTSTTYNPAIYVDNPTYYDDAELDDAHGNILYLGWKTPAGIWTNAKVLGPPPPPPKVADATPTVNPKPKPDCPSDGCELGARGDPQLHQRRIDLCVGFLQPLIVIHLHKRCLDRRQHT
jgi:hypothetical protein